VFTLPDGQVVPDSLVEGDSNAGFRLSPGALVTTSTGFTLDDLVEHDPEAHAFMWVFGNETYFYGSAALVQNDLPEGLSMTRVGSGAIFQNPASALVAAINNNADSRYWARLEPDPGYYRDGYASIYVFSKEAGDLCMEAYDKALGLQGNTRRVEDHVLWFNDETGESNERGVVFNNGGKYWGNFIARPNGYGGWSLELTGLDLGVGRNLKILNMGPRADLDLGALAGRGFGLRPDGSLAGNLSGLGRSGFVAIQNADDGNWAGAHLRTQSHAQEALEALTEAIKHKEKIRTALGSYMNRLENTMNKMEISVENLMTAESRISDVDMAREMTDFVKNQLLTQTGISLLSQVNSLPQMALALLNG
jgi:flagellin-like hook-associated protein FlgL